MIEKSEKIIKIGKPIKYKTPKELEDKVNEYFEKGYRIKKVINKHTGIEFELPILTTTDLALYLGFESRQSIYDYANRADYSYIIKKALFYIEREYEEALILGTNPTGSIFALKNMGWKDKSEVDSNLNGNIKVENITIL